MTEADTSLTTAALRDAMQTVINATTTLWYGTDEALTPGKVLMCKGNPRFGSPPFVIVHPDDVGLLPEGARHLREYAPTWEDLIAMRPISYEPPDEPISFRVRMRLP